MKHLICLTAAAAIILAGCGREPETFDEYLSAGKQAFVKEEYQTARDYLAQAVLKQPSNKQALYFAGLAYSRDQMYDSALHYLGRANVLFPGDREINAELYRIAPKMGEWDVARGAIAVLVATGDPEEMYWDELVDLNVQREKFLQALFYARKILDQNPGNLTNWLTAANAAVEAESLDVAIALTDSAIARFGEKNELLVNKALYYSRADQYAKAEPLLRKVLAEAPDNVGIKLNLAHTLALQNDRTKKLEAMSLYEDLKEKVGPEFKIDSLMMALDMELQQLPE